jgi:hypothetical protein
MRGPPSVARNAGDGRAAPPAPPWRRSWIAKARGLGMGPQVPGADHWPGAAQPMGNCAIVHNLVGDAPWTASDDRAGRCRAEPDRRGRVGVAHATRKCALVHNVSQAWGQSRPRGRSSGAGPPTTGLDHGLSLGRVQWPSNHTRAPQRLSCPSLNIICVTNQPSCLIVRKPTTGPPKDQ